MATTHAAKGLPPTGAALLRKIERKEATVSVIGLGYVGLPLALALAQEGFSVVGLDVDRERVAAITRGSSFIIDISDEELREVVRRGALKATLSPAGLAEADVIIICVPTPLNKTRDPDISFIAEAVEKVCRTLRRGQLIVLESTSYPGTTREVLLPALEAGGLKAGHDFFLAFSPERIDPANREFNLRNTPKIVGGITPACSRLAAALYANVAGKVLTVSSADSAEMVKLLENTFRAVNIGLVNEMAIMCRRLGLDVWEIIEAAATKPFGFMPFKPGPGLGGHCIPVDPHYLSWKLRTLNYTARFVEMAGEVNSHMPEYVVGLVSQSLNGKGRAVKGARILVMGAAYKKDVSDVRESPALDIINLLRSQGAVVSYHDPHVPELSLDGGRLRSRALTTRLLKAADCMVVVTDHSSFDWRRIVPHVRLVVDTRNALAAAGINDPRTIVKL